MPVQRFSSSPVDRPPGLVPPRVELSGLTEVRVHGVGGAGPETLLGDVAPQQVAGDRLAGFYRTADTYGADGRPRHVEAYSWGGLTSRSGARVLWLLLLPFTLANLAGWMCAPGVHASGWRFRLHRATVRWAALGLTVNMVLLATMTTMDLIGYQCGGLASCAGDRWWLGPLGSGVFTGFPARRVLVGALFPLLLVAGLGLLTLVAVRRYEDVEPPSRGDRPAAARGRGGAAQPRLGLADRGFWDGRGCVLDLGLLHLAAPVAVVALLVAHTVRTALPASGAVLGVPLAARHSWLAAVAFVLGVLVLVAAVVLVALDSCRPGVCFAVLATALVAVLAALAFAAAQPGFAQAAGPLPGMRGGAAVAYGVFIATLLLVLGTAALARRSPGSFWTAAPFVAMTCGYVLLNVVVLGVLIRLADVLSRVSFAEAAVAMAAGGTRVFVDEVIGWAVPYLTLVPLALIAAFTAYQILRYWLAGRDAERVAGIAAEYRTHDRPDDEPDWQVNALDGRFARLVARTRRLADAPHDVDRLLTVIAAAGLVVLTLGWLRVWAGDVVPGLPRWILTVGTWIATALPVVVLLVLRRGWRNVASRRHLGVLWDVGTFWPRAYHPLAPPSYAERAVPELQRRIWRIHDGGGRMVIAAHSQGTVLAAAALLQADCRPPGASVGLLTFGSPLRKLYGWGFPAYFADAVLRRLAAPGSPAVLTGWRNDHYRTDFIGGPVLDGTPEATTGGVDRELPDPPTCWHVYGQPRPSPGGHFGYWTDRAVWTGVERLADPR